MSEYIEWITQQDPLFITEICGKQQPQKRFKDYNIKKISLNELQELDKKFILGLSETNN